MRSYPTLALRNTLSSRVQLDPEQILIMSYSTQNIVAWYDFSDPDTMFTDVSGTAKASDGNRIMHVTNKAWDGLTSSSTSLNKFIAQSSATASDQPTWTSRAGLASGYLTYTGTEELFSTILLGQCSAGRMGGVTVNHENTTISFVIKNSNVTESSDHSYISFQNAARRLAIIGIESDDNQMHYWPEYSGSDVDSGTAYSTDIDSWTIIMGTANTSGTDVRNLRIYKNGVLVKTDTSTDYTGYDKDMTANSGYVQFTLGASPGSADQFVGRIYEYVQYNTALSDYQHDQLNTYYSNKYGIDYNLL